MGRHDRYMAWVEEQIVGVAIDVGSTTMSAHLCDMVSGDVLASTGVMNPQINLVKI